MATNTITLALNGTVPLDLFAIAIAEFNGMVSGIADDIVGPDKVEWEIARLESGSAIITARPLHAEPEEVEEIIDAYNILGQALSTHAPLPFSPDISKHAFALTGLLNGKITSISFSTPTQTFVVSEPVEEIEEDTPGQPRQYSYGVVKGELASMSTRPRLKISIYDTLFDRAVSCYPNDDYREMLRGAWGKRIAVTGLIRRNPNTGQPISIKEIISIEIETIPPTGSYKRARGLLPYEPGDPLPEIVIGSLRDATDQE
jgi:hypothetical protein